MMNEKLLDFLGKPAKIAETVNDSNSKETLVSVVLPVYNQASNIGMVITKLFQSMKTDFELIVIDDGSRDSTLQQLLNIKPDFFRFPNLKSVSIYRNRFSRFETYCDAFCIEKSTGKYLLEIQADMIINDPGFDLRLIECFNVDQKIVAISGRGVQTLAPIILDYKQVLGTDRARTSSFRRYLFERVIYQAKRLVKSLILFQNEAKIEHRKFESLNYFREKHDSEFLFSGCAGRLGQLIDSKVDPASFSRKLYIGQTVMRGPLMFDKVKYFEIGGLDELRFFQGFDDHDFSARALLNGFKVAYTSVNYDSPLELGSTRRTRTLLTEILIAVHTLRIKKTRLSSALNGDAILKAISDRGFSEVRDF